MGGIFEIIAIPLGWLMNLCYLLVEKLPLNYVIAMFLFALLTKVLTFPFSINQQKSSAKMAAINPLIQDIQKKFAKDKQRQQVETQKLQEEVGYNPMSGCLPMIIQMVLLFGFVEVIYAPLKYMLRLPAEFIESVSKITGRFLESNVTARLLQNNIIEQIQTVPERFASLQGMYGESLQQVRNLDMTIGPIKLWQIPSISQPSWLWLLPLFSVACQLLATIVTNKTSGAAQSGQPGSGKVMMFSMVGLSAVFSFMWPVGFSLYWGLQSLLGIGQSMILRKIVNSDKIKQDTLDAYNASKNAKKATKKVTVVDKKSGHAVEKEMSGTEIAKLRLQRARELDAEKYNDEETTEDKLDEYEGKKTDIDNKPGKKAKAADADNNEKQPEMFEEAKNKKKKK